MKRLGRILRMIPLAIICAIFALAALQVQNEREIAAKSTSLPTRIGQSGADQSFMQATLDEVGNMTLALTQTFLPGLVVPAAAPPQNPQSLSALKARTRFHAQGLNPDGSPKISF